MNYIIYLVLIITSFSCGKTDSNNQSVDVNKNDDKKIANQKISSHEPEIIKKTAADFKYDPKLEFTYDLGEENSISQMTILNASTEVLKKEQLLNLYKHELDLTRNLIYAKHGYIFKDNRLKDIFEKIDWYIPISDDVSSDLTEVELKNIELIKRYELHAKIFYVR